MGRSTHTGKVVFENRDFIVSLDDAGRLVITREYETKTDNGPYLRISPNLDDVAQDREAVMVIRPRYFKAVLLYE